MTNGQQNLAVQMIPLRLEIPSVNKMLNSTKDLKTELSKNKHLKSLTNINSAVHLVVVGTQFIKADPATN